MGHGHRESRYQATCFLRFLDEVVGRNDPVRVIECLRRLARPGGAGFSRVRQKK